MEARRDDPEAPPESPPLRPSLSVEALQQHNRDVDAENAELVETKISRLSKWMKSIEKVEVDESCKVLSMEYLHPEVKKSIPHLVACNQQTSQLTPTTSTDMPDASSNVDNRRKRMEDILRRDSQGNLLMKHEMSSRGRYRKQSEVNPLAFQTIKFDDLDTVHDPSGRVSTPANVPGHADSVPADSVVKSGSPGLPGPGVRREVKERGSLPAATATETDQGFAELHSLSVENFLEVIQLNTIPQRQQKRRESKVVTMLKMLPRSLGMGVMKEEEEIESEASRTSFLMRSLLSEEDIIPEEPVKEEPVKEEPRNTELPPIQPIPPIQAPVPQSVPEKVQEDIQEEAEEEEDTLEIQELQDVDPSVLQSRRFSRRRDSISAAAGGTLKDLDVFGEAKRERRTSTISEPGNLRRSSLASESGSTRRSSVARGIRRGSAFGTKAEPEKEEDEEEEESYTIKPALTSTSNKMSLSTIMKMRGLKKKFDKKKEKEKETFVKDENHQKYLNRHFDDVVVEIPIPMKMLLYDVAMPILQATVKAYQKAVGKSHALTLEAKDSVTELQQMGDTYKNM